MLALPALRVGDCDMQLRGAGQKTKRFTGSDGSLTSEPEFFTLPAFAAILAAFFC
jgi:hypothetical protein